MRTQYCLTAALEFCLPERSVQFHWEYTSAFAGTPWCCSDAAAVFQPNKCKIGQDLRAAGVADFRMAACNK